MILNYFTEAAYRNWMSQVYKHYNITVKHKIIPEKHVLFFFIKCQFSNSHQKQQIKEWQNTHTSKLTSTARSCINRDLSHAATLSAVHIATGSVVPCIQVWHHPGLIPLQ
jgi:hypothetical protein